MLNEKENITLAKNTATADDRDFAYLRKLGITYIEQMGSALWTDYNAHDPGITVLEMLCYAITDLGHRIHLPMEELLASQNGGIQTQFHEAHEILTCRPLTHLDYRKLFIDIPGVRNAWFSKHKRTVFANCKDSQLAYQSFLKKPEYSYLKEEDQQEFQLNGLYDLIVDAEDGYDFEELIKVIQAKYHQNRNLCEDLIHIDPVGEQEVKICAEIELHREYDEDEVKAKILLAIEDYFSPSIQPKTLATLLEQGKPTTEIFNGPLLNNGFLDNDEVLKASLKSEVRQSDLINLIMKVEGVKVIKDITMGACNDDTPDGSEWVICIDVGKKPAICDKSSWSFFKGLIPLNIDEGRVTSFKNKMRDDLAADLDEIAKAVKKLPLSQMPYTQVGSTTSIQNDFPEVYGIGPYGLKSNATTAERAKAKQLKGYLLFFDQVLANYFAHLEKFADQFSVSGKESRNYFAQAVEDLQGIDSLFDDLDFQNTEVLSEEFFRDVSSGNNSKRNQVLDHLLSRFAENFGEYAFLMSKIYGQFAEGAVIKTKTSFLNQYAKTSYERPRSFNYLNQPPENLWDTDNISAFQKRLYLLLGVTDINRRDLSEDYIEIYEEIDDDDILEYRWRIKDGSKSILSSATKHYATLEELYAELILVKRYALDANNYIFKKVIKENPENPDRWHFVLINPEISDPENEDYIIARRITVFESKAGAILASQAVLDFIKTLTGNEGMYLIEHILLLPDVTRDVASVDTFLPICKDNCDGDCEPIDPYSFRVSIILPGWTERFSNIDFRRFTEDLIRRELPAHIVAKICWIGYQKNYTDENGNPPEENEMVILETAYKAWLKEKTKDPQIQDTDTLKNLNHAISSLHTIYPQGRLHGCRPTDEGMDPDKKDEPRNTIILGRTNIGKL
ncbi:MAG: hypothetical protein WBG71_14380 [Leeuwenhoekiella sp.]